MGGYREISNKSKIASEVYISPNSQMFIDETSELVIEKNVVLKDVKISAMNNSKICKNTYFSVYNSLIIKMEKFTYIEDNVKFLSEEHTNIIINDQVYIYNFCQIKARRDVNIRIGNNTSLGCYDFFI